MGAGISSRSALAALVLLLVALAAPAVRAESTESASSAAPYSGDLGSRSTLSGDWLGARNELAAKGLDFDASLTQVGQGVVGGGKDLGWEYGGRGNLTIHGDTQKAGLWPGGFLTVEVEGNFSDSVNDQIGALGVANSNQLYPQPKGGHLNVPNVSFMQFFSPYVGVNLGKVDTTSGDMNEFAHGKGDSQFMNLALNFNMPLLFLAPYSTLSAGLIVLPTKDPAEATVILSVVQTPANAGDPGFDELDWDKLAFIGEGRVRTDFFGLTGHQLLGFVYSDKKYASLDQDARFLLENQAIATENGSWAVYYNFDQYFYETEKGSGRGAGVFGRFGASDGDPNPMHFLVSAGVGGKGITPGRQALDGFGIGFYYVDVKSPQFTGPLATQSFLRDEYGFEAYYEVAITPWLHLTPDVQVIRPAQKQVVGIFPGPTIVRQDIDWTTIVGFRLRMVL